MTRAATWMFVAIAAVGALAAILYLNSNAYAETLAEWHSDGRCFICSRPLVAGDDIASYLHDPTLGLAHFACVEKSGGPLTEVD